MGDMTPQEIDAVVAEMDIPEDFKAEVKKRLGARAGFKSMDTSSQEDWDIIATHAAVFNKGAATRVLDHLQLLEGDAGGFIVDRLTHSLQTATRAHKDGRDEEYVVAALLHDMGDMLCSTNHPDLAAAVLKPYVSEDIHWMVEHHGIFQGYYFFHRLGLDKDMREQYRGHPHFELTAEFCEKYDQTAFDPNYESMSLEDFRPMVERVFEKPKRSVYMKEAEAEAAE